MDDKKLKTVPLNKIKISDQFWNRYIHLVKDVLILVCSPSRGQ